MSLLLPVATVPSSTFYNTHQSSILKMTTLSQTLAFQKLWDGLILEGSQRHRKWGKGRRVNHCRISLTTTSNPPHEKEHRIMTLIKSKPSGSSLYGYFFWGDNVVRLKRSIQSRLGSNPHFRICGWVKTHQMMPLPLLWEQWSYVAVAGPTNRNIILQKYCTLRCQGASALMPLLEQKVRACRFDPNRDGLFSGGPPISMWRLSPTQKYSRVVLNQKKKDEHQ